MKFLVSAACFILSIGVLGAAGLGRTPSLFSRDIAIDGLNATITPLTLSSDKQSYYVTLKLGALTFRAALDTASADLWITSTDCKSSACSTTPKYPSTYHSPTFSVVNSNTSAYKVSFADGSGASGFVAKETVTIGNMSIPEQAFGLITDGSVTFSDQESGILGLGFSRLSRIDGLATSSSPLFTNLAEKGLLEYPLFGLSLTRNNTGTLALGAIDGSVVKNVTNIEWNAVVQFPPIGSENNVTSYWQWALPLKGISVNGGAVSLTPSYPDMTGGNSLAMFDVGTSGIYGPWGDVAKIFAKIDEARLVDATGQWVIPCATSVPMTFTFGSSNYTLQPSDYLIGPTSGNPNLCLSWPRAMPPSPDGIEWQLGTPFLRTVYSIFSFGIDIKESPMIGLYPLNNSIPNTLVPSLFSSISATIATTAPNSLLPTPSVTASPYSLNTSFTGPTGEIVSSQLANSTYNPIFAQQTNLSAIPVITASPTVQTLTITDSAGVHTTTSTSVAPSVVLGAPWLNGAFSVKAGLGMGWSWGILLVVGLNILL